MTEKKDITVSFNLGYKPNESDLEWYFGDKKFDEWRNQVTDTIETGEPVFTVKDVQIADNGDVSATIAVNYLFDGGDAAYWRPWYEFRGMYELKVVDTSTDKSAAAEIRYEVYDSYHYSDEMDETINGIIESKTNDIYMSYESTGKSVDGKDIKVVIVAKNKEAVDKYLALKERAETCLLYTSPSPRD